jgi:ABC-type uncharacterized transport system permease subunit
VGSVVTVGVANGSMPLSSDGAGVLALAVVVLSSYTIVSIAIGVLVFVLAIAHLSSPGSALAPAIQGLATPSATRPTPKPVC